MTTYNVTIHADGACRGNPGKGGYAALLQCNGRSKIITGAVENTTNNRMELMAVVEGLKALNAPCQVVVHSDSRFVVQGISLWMHSWANQGWHKSNGETPVHADLWQQLHKLAVTHSISALWVQGQSGNEMNREVHQLAKASILT